MNAGGLWDTNGFTCAYTASFGQVPSVVRHTMAEAEPFFSVTRAAMPAAIILAASGGDSVRKICPL